MDFIRALLEDGEAAGVTSTSSVAAIQSDLGSQVISRLPKPRKMFNKKRRNVVSISPHVTSSGYVSESDARVDAADVVSKIRAAQQSNKLETQSVILGLQDEHGGIVKVYVPPEVAEEFEAAVADMLASDHDKKQLDVVEMLYDLKDRFDILYVEWPTEEENDEVEVKQPAKDAQPESSTPEEQDSGDQLDDFDASADGNTDELGVNVDQPPTPAPADLAITALDKVIAVLQANAEAQKAEADARAKEAAVREVEAANSLARTKMNAQLKVLDMERWEKQKKAEKSEANMLKRMAAYTHETNRLNNRDQQEIENGVDDDFSGEDL